MSDNTVRQSSSRRRFVSVAAATVAAGSLSQLAFAEPDQAVTEVAQSTSGDKTAIRPLRVHVPESQLIDLRRHIKATRWPENYQAPRSWTERAYHNRIYYNRVDKGGHFAAWEQPQLFAEEVRAGLRPLRT
ncbi:pimeloyl-ACP methyl ester carboxylesterase [Caballeronia udeis]|jgi:hypothetical protein|uniref:Pimeloyl-ACP methyl ester carboxylesterase n=1 Tax=Caballeronia udeis TaxID=1232866 RepID=A0ABW8MRC9_9BURK